METLYPTSHTFNSKWLKQGFQRTNWTTEENGTFESCLALFDEDTPDRWLQVASMIPGKSVLDVIEQYKKLEDDISDIEAGLFPLPERLQDDASTKKLAKNQYLNEFGKRPFACRSSDHEKRKGQPWTEDEHRQFLMGLRKHGKGDWRNISRNFVITKTSIQVASHAQKYYLRQLSEGKEKKRPSIHDITTVHLTDATPFDKHKFPADKKSNFIPQPEISISMPKSILDRNKINGGSLMMFNSMHNNKIMPFKHEFGGHGANINPLNSGFQFQATRHRIW
ncbi:transcription factor DIVARICATA-like [Apium graveolens]|uniref:transcription factor DIVARICATA-like n=1 Tax=Apium graveolens TaxID=4045 RepID=UPI003D7A3149